ncbi:MAG: sugar transferase [Desulfobaccales bacterium]
MLTRPTLYAGISIPLMLRLFGQTIPQWTVLLAAGDILVFMLSLFLGNWLEGLSEGQRFVFPADILTLIMLGGVYLTVLYVGEMYNFYLDFRRRENVGQVLLWALAASLVAMLIFCYPTPKILPRSFIEWQALGFIWLLVFWRYAFSAMALPVHLKRKLLIVGAGQAGRRILEALHRRPQSGFEPVGFVDDDPGKTGAAINGLRVLGTSADLESLIAQHQVKMVITAITHEKTPGLLNTLTRLSLNGLPVLDMPSFYEFLARKVPIDHISDTWLFVNSLKGQRQSYRHLKFVVELALAAAGFLITAPLFLLIAAAIKLDSPGPVSFRQRRLGKDGKPFFILKFRTMYQNAENGSPKWASSSDPRITRVGRLLRKVRLDELPQLINILKGEMSLIGPRAEWDVFACNSQEKVTRYRPGRRATDPPGTLIPCGTTERLPYYSFRNIIRPGVTGWAQVMFPMAGSSPEDLKEKLQYDLYYIKNMGFLLDFQILLKTIRIVLLGKGK